MTIVIDCLKDDKFGSGGDIWKRYIDYHNKQKKAGNTNVRFESAKENEHCNRYINNDFACWGMLFTGYEAKDRFSITRKHHKIELFVNLRQLLNCDNTEVVCYRGTEKEKELLKKRFNQAVWEVFKWREWWTVEFMKWQIWRIDYTVDVKTPEVETYLKLLKKGKIPRNAKIYEKDGTVPEGSHYLKNKSTHWNFYSKESRIEYQIERDVNNVKKTELHQKRLNKAGDILRIEIQEQHRRVNRLIDSKSKKYQDLNLSWYSFLNPETATNELINYLKRVEVEARYMTERRVINRINNSNYNKDTKDDMIAFLRLVKKKGETLETARFKFIQKHKYTRDRFNRLLKRFEEIDANPITIAKGELPSVCELVRHDLETAYAPTEA